MILTVPRFLKKRLFYRRSPIHHASFDTFKAKIVWLFIPQTTFECPRDLWFYSILKLDDSKVDLSRNFRDWFWNNRLTYFSFECVKRSVLNVATTFCKIFYQNYRFLWNSWPLKISLLQCYEVLWIQNIDTFCTE